MDIDQPRRTRIEHIRAELSRIDIAIPGSVVVRTARCGKSACSCRADPPRLHGPYISWTRKVGGKTVTRLLTEQQLADYQPFLHNAQRLRQLVAELEMLSLEAVAEDPRWGRI